ncbi:MAG: heavy-metal-associated domain-containing protein [Gemmatimonadales bacterium]
MGKKRTVVAGLTALGAVVVLPGAVAAQDRNTTRDSVVAVDSMLAGATVHLFVDGMVCPFCAYGLEKRLLELAAVDSLIVRVSDGLVQIREKEGQTLTEEDVRREVERAGFTLREINRVRR